MKLKTCLLGCAAALTMTSTPRTAWAQATPAGPPAAPTDATAVDQASPASASPASAAEVGEIVVTAQRRAENLQRVPIVITAVSGQQLAAAGITSLPNLQAIAPGLNVRTTGGGVFQPSLRGIGTSSNVVENPVALYIDGVYLPSQREGNRELPDVEQVAVLKGPQGTLFGRNATGGVIQITTRRPSQELRVRGQGGDRQLRDLPRRAGSCPGGSANGVAASLSADFATQGDGYGRNLTTGHDTFQIAHALGLRGKLLLEPDAAPPCC